VGRIYLYILLTLLVACQSEDGQPKITSNLFQDLGSSRTGISFNNKLHFDPNLNIIEYLYYYNGGGVAVGDLDNDGLEDIYFTGNQVPDQLYRNSGNLEFEDISRTSKIGTDDSWSSGVTIVDVNGDGLNDIYVCKVNRANDALHNLLYINKGGMLFEESSEEYGLNFSGFSTQAAFLDYDRDGDLDMYLANHSMHTVRSYGTIEKRKERSNLFGDVFYENRLNESEGRFVDVSEEVGIYSSALGYGLTLIASDVNNDGWMDIYVGNDFHENDYLYINNGDKTFTESIKTLTSHTSKFTMGVDACDMNNDGLIDLFTTDMLPYDPSILLKSAGEESNQIQSIKKDFGFEEQYARNHFQLQNTQNSFTDIALLTETYATDWSWSTLLQDFDNNGWNDIFITNGIVKRPNDLDYINFLNEVSFDGLNEDKAIELTKALIDKMPTLKIPNKLFLNTSQSVYTPFDEISVGNNSFSNGSAYSDLDNDGDLDLVINHINQTASILENSSASSSNYISVQLKGSIEKPNTIGSKCKVFTNKGILSKEISVTRGFQSSSSHVLHFGLGENRIIDSLIVVWPDGKHQTNYNVEPGTRVIIERNNSLLDYNYSSSNDSEFEFSVLPLKHNENDYKDYDHEVLIPEMLSREGPAVLIDDLNGDGREDIFLGGAKNQAARLFLLQSDGSYSVADIESFERDAIYEDVDVASFDYDKDGDLDLYVVSGGSTANELDKELEDRIYINMSNGIFVRFPISLPHTNGSTVTIADFDGDGYEDIFVGARSIPGIYGLSPFSFLLRNKAAQGVEILSKVRYGMVTDSKAMDLNDDGYMDLVLAGDWMPITVLYNDGKGILNFKTEELGLSNTSGFWNTIELVDIDGDDDIDILGGNSGENFILNASVENPIELYLNDYDNNDQIDPLIFRNQRGELIPLATKDNLTKQLPFLKKQYPSYSSYSKVRDLKSLTGVAPQEILELKRTKELRSMLFINENDTYTPVPLPKEAQLSDINDFLVESSESGGIRIKFVGNRLEYTSDIGSNGGNSGGELSLYNSASQSFDRYRSLELPKKLNTRGIIPFAKNRYLISANDDYLYILKDKKQ